MRDCGSCSGFIKLKNSQYSSGLCDVLDCRTNSDSGKDCMYWKGIKYNKRDRRKKHGSKV